MAETRRQKFERLAAEADARADQAEADGAGTATVAYIRGVADNYRRQSIATLRKRPSHATGRAGYERSR